MPSVKKIIKKWSHFAKIPVYLPLLFTLKDWVCAEHKIKNMGENVRALLIFLSCLGSTEMSGQVLKSSKEGIKFGGGNLCLSRYNYTKVCFFCVLLFSTYEHNLFTKQGG